MFSRSSTWPATATSGPPGVMFILRSGEARSLRPLHLSAYVSDPLGATHGCFHAPVLGRPQRHQDHQALCSSSDLAKLDPFDLYTFRHTCLTRWAPHMDVFTLQYLAGHSDIRTTRRYVHPQDRKSTRLNSSHLGISYAVFCLKKKQNQPRAVSFTPAPSGVPSAQ